MNPLAAIIIAFLFISNIVNLLMWRHQFMINKYLQEMIEIVKHMIDADTQIIKILNAKLEMYLNENKN